MGTTQRAQPEPAEQAVPLAYAPAAERPRIVTSVRQRLGPGGTTILTLATVGAVASAIPAVAPNTGWEPLVLLLVYGHIAWLTALALFIRHGVAKPDTRRRLGLEMSDLARGLGALMLVAGAVPNIDYDPCPHGVYLGFGPVHVCVSGERCHNDRDMKPLLRLLVPR